MDSIGDLVAIAVILDVISQFLIFWEVHPGAALLVGPVLVAVTVFAIKGFGKSHWQCGGSASNSGPTRLTCEKIVKSINTIFTIL